MADDTISENKVRTLKMTVYQFDTTFSNCFRASFIHKVFTENKLFHGQNYRTFDLFYSH